MVEFGTYVGVRRLVGAEELSQTDRVRGSRHGLHHICTSSRVRSLNVNFLLDIDDIDLFSYRAGTEWCSDTPRT